MYWTNKLKMLCAGLLLVGGIQAQQVCVSTPGTSLVLSAPEGGELKYVYYGPKLAPADLEQLPAVEKALSAYPAYGLYPAQEAALAVEHGDGNLTLDLAVQRVSTQQEDKALLTVVELKDKVYPFYVNICYRAWQDADVIETWTEISHAEKKPVVLTRFDSGCLPIRRGEVWLSHLNGSWANESRLVEEPLLPGMKVIKNKDGTRNSHTSHAEVMLSLDGQPRENQGRVIMIFTLTDETYSVNVSIHSVPKNVDEPRARFLIGELDHLYWIFGSVVGSLLGQSLPIDFTGIDFSMTALFTVIFVDLLIDIKNKICGTVGIFCAFICLMIFGADNFLLPALILTVVLLVAAKPFLSKKGVAE